MDIFDSVISVFNFIYSLLDTIIQGLYGIITIITSFIGLVLSIIRILPNPLYPCFMVFVNLYLIIFTYQIFRKG